jgi:hypothetical protein
METAYLKTLSRIIRANATHSAMTTDSLGDDRVMFSSRASLRRLLGEPY